jgi:hypothetical protein
MIVGMIRLLLSSVLRMWCLSDGSESGRRWVGVNVWLERKQVNV